LLAPKTVKLIEIKRGASLADETGVVFPRLMEEPEHIDLDNVRLASGQVILAEARNASRLRRPSSLDAGGIVAFDT
jgi:hypothetical protein